ncbi:MAG: hypothetical protein Q9218_006638 [Villophora microphyllina]
MDESRVDSRLSVLSPPSSEASAKLLSEEFEDGPSTETSSGEAQASKPPKLCWHSGKGLGPVDLRFFTREIWPLRNKAESTQYRKFITIMIERMRAGESNNSETARFCRMVGTVEHWNYILPIVDILPKSEENGPRPQNEQMTMLVDHIGRLLEAKGQERFERQVNKYARKEDSDKTAEQVLAETRAKIEKLLLGPKGAADPTPEMKRLFDSWVELGYPDQGQMECIGTKYFALLIVFPDSVVKELMDKCEKSGREMSWNSIGLPHGLGDDDQARLQQHGSKLHNPEAQKLAPVSVLSPGHRQGPMTKGSPVRSSPPKLSQASATKRSHRPDDRGYSSVEIDDSPPNWLLEEPTEEEKRSHHKTGTTSAPTLEDCFRHFDRPVPTDYRKIVSPTTKEVDVVPQVKKVGWSQCQKTKTGDGMLMVRGFDKPPAAKTHAILKEIDDTAATYPLMGDAPIILHRPTPGPARTKTSSSDTINIPTTQRNETDLPSSGDTIVAEPMMILGDTAPSETTGQDNAAGGNIQQSRFTEAFD